MKVESILPFPSSELELLEEDLLLLLLLMSLMSLMLLLSRLLLLLLKELSPTPKLDSSLPLLSLLSLSIKIEANKARVMPC